MVGQMAMTSSWWALWAWASIMLLGWVASCRRSLSSSLSLSLHHRLPSFQMSCYVCSSRLSVLGFPSEKKRKRKRRQAGGLRRQFQKIVALFSLQAMFLSTLLIPSRFGREGGRVNSACGNLVKVTLHFFAL